MARYDGLIIPRSYSDYINKTDAATLVQALQQNNVMDNAPTENSDKPAKSGGIYSALAGKQPTLTFDDVPTEDSAHPVKSGGVYSALGDLETTLGAEIDGKQDTLTFDNTPTASSDNPVKSGGVYSALNNANSYSTSETATGATWIDGSPIYRKVITKDINAGDALTFVLPVATNKKYLDIKVFTSLFNNNRYQFDAQGNWSSYEIKYFHVDNNLSFSLGSGFASFNFTLYVVVDYF